MKNQFQPYDIDTTTVWKWLSSLLSGPADSPRINPYRFLLIKNSRLYSKLLPKKVKLKLTAQKKTSLNFAKVKGTVQNDIFLLNTLMNPELYSDQAMSIQKGYAKCQNWAANKLRKLPKTTRSYPNCRKSTKKFLNWNSSKTIQMVLIPHYLIRKRT